MLIVSWDPFLMKKLLKNDVCGSINSAQMHYSHRKSTFTAWKKKVKNVNAVSVPSQSHLSYFFLMVSFDTKYFLKKKKKKPFWPNLVPCMLSILGGLSIYNTTTWVRGWDEGI